MKVKHVTYHKGTFYTDVPSSDIFGAFAVAPILQEDANGKPTFMPEEGWNVVHIPTGLSALPKIIIDHKNDALVLAERFAALPKDIIDMVRLGDREAIKTFANVYNKWLKGK